MLPRVLSHPNPTLAQTSQHGSRARIVSRITANDSRSSINRIAVNSSRSLSQFQTAGKRETFLGNHSRNIVAKRFASESAEYQRKQDSNPGNALWAEESEPSTDYSQFSGKEEEGIDKNDENESDDEVGEEIEDNDVTINVNLLGVGLFMGTWIGAITLMGGPTLGGFLSGTAITGLIGGAVFMYRQRIGVDVPMKHWEYVEEKMAEHAPAIEAKYNLKPGTLTGDEVEVHRAPSPGGNAVTAYEFPDGSYYVAIFQSTPGSVFLRNLSYGKDEASVQPVWTAPEATKVVEQAAKQTA